MAIVTTRYIRKPLYVDAVQVSEENMEDLARWCQSEIRVVGQDDWTAGEQWQVGSKYIYVRVHSPRSPRQTRAFPGDWILYTEKGYKVYTTRAFEASFDMVKEAA